MSGFRSYDDTYGLTGYQFMLNGRAYKVLGLEHNQDTGEVGYLVLGVSVKPRWWPEAMVLRVYIKELQQGYETILDKVLALGGLTD